MTRDEERAAWWAAVGEEAEKRGLTSLLPQQVIDIACDLGLGAFPTGWSATHDDEPPAAEMMPDR